jgi:two-component system response regulator AtoC
MSGDNTTDERSSLRETVLVVHGDDRTQQRLKATLRTGDRDVFLAAHAKEALASLHQLEPALIFVDLELSDLPGVRVIDVFRERAPGVPVVALADTPTVAGAVEALRHGAADYLGLHEPRARMLEVSARALQEAGSSKNVAQARQQVRDRYGFQHMLTQSPRMLHVLDEVRAVAVTDATALVLGETGTGKELVTRAIHERSRRRDKPFISVNCGAFTESLLESELFGHERGSFTGAVGRREGLFEMADGGTLFLDELGETSLNVQVNLLRVLEEMSFRRVGGREPVRIDVRILAATHVDLSTAVSEGKFRQDLYYRLNVFPIKLPPLRERREDISLLMRHFLDEISVEYELEPPIVSVEALSAILAYPWPGNVRQLRAMCERWVIIRPGQRLEREHLPPDMSAGTAHSEGIGGLHIDETVSMKHNTDRIVQQIERAFLFKVLRRCAGHLDQSADAAGISRRTLYTKMKQYSLDGDDFR